MFVGRIKQGLRALEEAAVIAEKVGDLATLCGAINDLAAYHNCAGEFARAKSLAERYLALAEQLGDVYIMTSALITSGQTDILTGVWPRARCGLPGPSRCRSRWVHRGSTLIRWPAEAG